MNYIFIVDNFRDLELNLPTHNTTGCTQKWEYSLDNGDKVVVIKAGWLNQNPPNK